MSLEAESMCWRFMLPSGLLGVPTVMNVMSVSSMASSVWLAISSRLFFMTLLSSGSKPGSWNGGMPWRICAAFSVLFSEAKTVYPLFASATAVHKPTYPKPMMEIFGFLMATPSFVDL